ncbi:pyrroline-5-carboxylate reductase dimerization-domain-containing protein [Aspergillus egyptiacus]|nr:pyrroline-5-carboxylate reductase dimerization-domain-containing protein [Aspergillus egyptiacus]
MSDSKNGTLCILGCGNLGTAILKSLLSNNESLFSKYICCVQTESSAQRLRSQFPTAPNLQISTGGNTLQPIQDANVIILALDPSVIHAVLTTAGLRPALAGKLLISVAAGWTAQKLEETLYSLSSSSSSDGHGNILPGTSQTSKEEVFILRALPNIAAQVGQSLTAIEIDPTRPIPPPHLDLTERIFSAVGKTLHVPPSLMDAATAVAGSTPAMFAVIVDAMIDASVAVGVPRQMAAQMVFQAMHGTAEMLQGGMHPGVVRDLGTAPEGCTIGGLMVLEERGVRGGVGRAVREAVTVARRMDGVGHVNDTRV